jgi:hypothetical protein
VAVLLVGHTAAPLIKFSRYSRENTRPPKPNMVGLFGLSELGNIMPSRSEMPSESARFSAEGDGGTLEKIMGVRTVLGGMLMIGPAVGAARGAAYNFAVFTDLSGSRPFSFSRVNGGLSAIITTSSISSSSSAPVTFDFTTPTGLNSGPRAATLTITGSASTQVSDNPPLLRDQPITTAALSITENSTGKNLLSMTFTGILAGIVTSPNPAFRCRYGRSDGHFHLRLSDLHPAGQ